jgi:hypothetical protein
MSCRQHRCNKCPWQCAQNCGAGRKKKTSSSLSCSSAAAAAATAPLGLLLKQPLLPAAATPAAENAPAADAAAALPLLLRLLAGLGCAPGVGGGAEPGAAVAAATAEGAVGSARWGILLMTSSSGDSREAITRTCSRESVSVEVAELQPANEGPYKSVMNTQCIGNHRSASHTQLKHALMLLQT